MNHELPNWGGGGRGVGGARRPPGGGGGAGGMRADSALRSRPRALAAILAALSILGAACGAGGDLSGTVLQPSATQPAGVGTAAETETVEANGLPSRVRSGIEAASGSQQAVGGDAACNEAGARRVAYVGADLSELDVVGAGALAVEDPVHVIRAYIDELNALGGIHGRCVEFSAHLWRLGDPIGSFIGVCNELAEVAPLFYFNFRFYDSGLQCTTFGTPVPELGLWSSTLEQTIADSGYLLYTDDGSVEHATTLIAEVALEAGVIDGDVSVGLLHGTGRGAGLDVSTVEHLLANAGVNVVAVADIPRRFDDLMLLMPEMEVGLLDPDRSGAAADLSSLTPEVGSSLADVERFYVDAATRFADAGVRTVIASASWADVRRLMRAAEIIDWAPQWLTGDLQPATLTTADAPARQVGNFRQVSARRAAGDLVPLIDQGCITMRNSTSAVAPFGHRPHTDAWNLITSVCDYLDVAFGALSRVGGDVDHVTFVDALNRTDYTTPHGSRITYSGSDRHGEDRFRILEVDQSCVLNGWGCMRAVSGWLTPSHTMAHEHVDVDDIRDDMNEMGHDHGDSSGPDATTDDSHDDH